MTSDIETSAERPGHRDEVCYASVKQSALLSAATFAVVLLLVTVAVLAF